LPLALPSIGAAWYTGNCHKWMCAPKGAGFLWARRDRQDDLWPTVISHGANAPAGERSRFHLLFDWTGTDDATAWLCVPEAIRAVASFVPGGWPEVMARNHALSLAGRRVLCEALGIAPPAPDDLLGSLAAVPIPGPGSPRSPLAVDPLQNALRFEEGIEVPIFLWPDGSRRIVRISAQLYNRIDDYQKLAAALVARL
jgi:isopenicillin-N epimerase